ncbi:MAG: low molecular weight phosphotyrosine protein phosphatase [Bacteroidales bacterium]|nr:low molecular weight phosphotyrosine protein phosphatase [Bacteroidales bacterium]
MKILFVCLGNICRSPMAECVMASVINDNNIKGVTVDSVGLIGYHTGEEPDSRMRSAARSKGYIMRHRARKISDEDFRTADLIVGMDGDNITRLRHICPKTEYLSKIHSVAEYFSGITGYTTVPDPYYGSERDFYKVIELLENACEGIRRAYGLSD